jgi:predicted nucleic acid-binding protein
VSAGAATPLFVDTSAFFAHFVENAPRHDTARTTMRHIDAGRLRFDPLYTMGHTLGELATLVLRKVGHRQSLRAVRRVRRSDAITVLHPDTETVGTVVDEFERYDDHQISFVDHTTAVLADDRDADHVFAFDSDFRTLGLGVVPGDVSL